MRIYLCFICGIGVGFSCSEKNAFPPPNIVLILVDDLGAKDLGFMSNTYHETPNIDAFAKDGIVFSSAYSNAPNCAPTRASLLTGLYSPRHGIYTVGSSKRGKTENRKIIPTENKTLLDTTFTTFAEVLRTRGYTNGFFGKWHLGEGAANGPLAQGFDLNVGGNKSGHPKSYFSPYENPNLDDGPEGEYLTDRLTDEAIEFVEKNKSKPFLLFLSFYSVHTPIQGKEELVEKYINKTSPYSRYNSGYAAMIESVDQNIGRLLQKLNTLGLDENTLVIFYSDNGPYYSVTTSEPLRGSKGMLYEGGVRVPLVMRWPQFQSSNSTVNTPVSSIDLYPTIAEAAGVSIENYKIDGISMLPVLKGNPIPHRSLFWHFPAYLETYGGMEGYWRQTPAGSIRKGDWKLIEFFEDSHLELYNIKEDIGEKNNLVSTQIQICDSLYNDLVRWRNELEAPVPIILNPEYIE